MFLLQAVSFVMRLLSFRWIRHRLHFFTFPKRIWLHLSCYILLSSVLLVSCSGFGGDATQSSGVVNVALSGLRWCGKPLMVFRDEAAPAISATSTVTATAQATATATATPSYCYDDEQLGTSKTGVGFHGFPASHASEWYVPDECFGYTA